MIRVAGLQGAYRTVHVQCGRIGRVARAVRHGTRVRAPVSRVRVVDRQQTGFSAEPRHRHAAAVAIEHVPAGPVERPRHVQRSVALRHGTRHLGRLSGEYGRIAERKRFDSREN